MLLWVLLLGGLVAVLVIAALILSISRAERRARRSLYLRPGPGRDLTIEFLMERNRGRCSPSCPMCVARARLRSARRSRRPHHAIATSSSCGQACGPTARRSRPTTRHRMAAILRRLRAATRATRASSGARDRRTGGFPCPINGLLSRNRHSPANKKRWWAEMAYDTGAPVAPKSEASEPIRRGPLRPSRLATARSRLGGDTLARLVQFSDLGRCSPACSLSAGSAAPWARARILLAVASVYEPPPW